MGIRTQTRSTSLAGDAAVALYESYSIATWGDSLTQGIPGERTPFQDQLAAAGLGFRRIYNGGIGGQNSEQIRDRMLAATDKVSQSIVIWAGRNDKSDFGAWGSRTLAAIAAMVAALDAAGNSRYLVLGVTNNGAEYAANTGTNADNYNAIVALNAQLATIYGSRFWDVRSWMVTSGLSAVSLSPTAGDLVDIARDVIPTSLRVDATNVHFNSTGNQAIAIGLVPLLEAMHSGLDFGATYGALVAGTGAGFAAESITTQTLYLGQDKAVNGGKFLEAQPVYGNTYAGHLRGISPNFDPVVTLDNTIFGFGETGVTPDLYGRGNSIFGSRAAPAATSLNFATLQGSFAGASLVDGSWPTYIGRAAGQSKVTGVPDTFIGGYAGNKSTSANPATFGGYQSGYNTTTGDGTFYGVQSAVGNTTGRFSVALGNFALGANATGSRYVAIGDDALKAANTTGKAIGIGYGVATNLTTGDGVFVGYNTNAPSATAAGQIAIANLLFGTGATGTGSNRHRCLRAGDDSGRGGRARDRGTRRLRGRLLARQHGPRCPLQQGRLQLRRDAG